MSSEISLLAEMMKKASRIVFLGGAGVSTESGIPDFRSENGVFQATKEFGYPPEVLISHTFFMKRTAEFYRYYRKNLLYPDAKPNPAHAALSKMEWGSASPEKKEKPRGKLTAVITQNIDNLHQAAGSKNVLELHGSVYRNYCMKCRKYYSLNELIAKLDEAEDGIPRCSCGGIIKPDVVLYEEGLDQKTLIQSVHHIEQADMMIIGGTSLMVYPAAGLCDYFRGNNLVVINLSDTAKETGATLAIHRPIGEVLHEAVSILQEEELDRS